MKLSRSVIALVLIASLGLTGCGKSNSSSPPPPTANGATLDVGKLLQTLASSTSPDVKKGSTDLYLAMRYSDYDKAGAALEKIAADPSLTDVQKKAVSEAQEQVKQMAAKPAQ
ncbi:MAG TPA: hypothetical protein VN281_02405 [Verrucomicrobiae bacterium]|nr:hypothetical protein [Verrucomicrobiae bacterium]